MPTTQQLRDSEDPYSLQATEQKKGFWSNVLPSWVTNSGPWQRREASYDALNQEVADSLQGRTEDGKPLAPMNPLPQVLGIEMQTGYDALMTSPFVFGHSIGELGAAFGATATEAMVNSYARGVIPADEFGVMGSQVSQAMQIAASHDGPIVVPYVTNPSPTWRPPMVPLGQAPFDPVETFTSALSSYQTARNPSAYGLRNPADLIAANMAPISFYGLHGNFFENPAGMDVAQNYSTYMNWLANRDGNIQKMEQQIAGLYALADLTNPQTKAYQGQAIARSGGMGPDINPALRFSKQIGYTTDEIRASATMLEAELQDVKKQTPGSYLNSNLSLINQMVLNFAVDPYALAGHGFEMLGLTKGQRVAKAAADEYLGTTRAEAAAGMYAAHTAVPSVLQSAAQPGVLSELNPFGLPATSHANLAMDSFEIIGSNIARFSQDRTAVRAILDELTLNPALAMRQGIDVSGIPGVANQMDSSGMLHLGPGNWGNQATLKDYAIFDAAKDDIINLPSIQGIGKMNPAQFEREWNALLSSKAQELYGVGQPSAVRSVLGSAISSPPVVGMSSGLMGEANANAVNLLADELPVGQGYNPLSKYSHPEASAATMGGRIYDPTTGEIVSDFRPGFGENAFQPLRDYPAGQLSGVQVFDTPPTFNPVTNGTPTPLDTVTMAEPPLGQFGRKLSTSPDASSLPGEPPPWYTEESFEPPIMSVSLSNAEPPTSYLGGDPGLFSQAPVVNGASAGNAMGMVQGPFPALDNLEARGWARTNETFIDDTDSHLYYYRDANGRRLSRSESELANKLPDNQSVAEYRARSEASTAAGYDPLVSATQMRPLEGAELEEMTVPYQFPSVAGPHTLSDYAERSGLVQGSAAGSHSSVMAGMWSMLNAQVGFVRADLAALPGFMRQLGQDIKGLPGLLMGANDRQRGAQAELMITASPGAWVGNATTGNFNAAVDGSYNGRLTGVVEAGLRNRGTTSRILESLPENYLAPRNQGFGSYAIDLESGPSVFDGAVYLSDPANVERNIAGKTSAFAQTLWTGNRHILDRIGAGEAGMAERAYEAQQVGFLERYGQPRMIEQGAMYRAAGMDALDAQEFSQYLAGALIDDPLNREGGLARMAEGVNDLKKQSVNPNLSIAERIQAHAHYTTARLDLEAETLATASNAGRGYFAEVGTNRMKSLIYDDAIVGGEAFGPMTQEQAILAGESFGPLTPAQSAMRDTLGRAQDVFAQQTLPLYDDAMGGANRAATDMTRFTMLDSSVKNNVTSWLSVYTPFANYAVNSVANTFRRVLTQPWLAGDYSIVTNAIRQQNQNENATMRDEGTFPVTVFGQEFRVRNPVDRLIMPLASMGGNDYYDSQIAEAWQSGNLLQLGAGYLGKAGFQPMLAQGVMTGLNPNGYSLDQIAPSLAGIAYGVRAGTSALANQLFPNAQPAGQTLPNAVTPGLGSDFAEYGMGRYLDEQVQAGKISAQDALAVKDYIFRRETGARPMDKEDAHLEQMYNSMMAGYSLQQGASQATSTLIGVRARPIFDGETSLNLARVAQGKLLDMLPLAEAGQTMSSQNDIWDALSMLRIQNPGIAGGLNKANQMLLPDYKPDTSDEPPGGYNPYVEHLLKFGKPNGPAIDTASRPGMLTLDLGDRKIPGAPAPTNAGAPLTYEYSMGTNFTGLAGIPMLDPKSIDRPGITPPGTEPVYDYGNVDHFPHIPDLPLNDVDYNPAAITALGGPYSMIGTDPFKVHGQSAQRFSPAKYGTPTDDPVDLRPQRGTKVQGPARQGDDLTMLEGVGPKTQDKLNAAGYFTYDQLGRATLDEIMDIDGITEDVANQIFDGTRPQSAGQFFGSLEQRQQEILNRYYGGPAALAAPENGSPAAIVTAPLSWEEELETLPKIGPSLAGRLAAQYGSWEELAAADPKKLDKEIVGFGEVLSQQVVSAAQQKLASASSAQWGGDSIADAPSAGGIADASGWYGSDAYLKKSNEWYMSGPGNDPLTNSTPMNPIKGQDYWLYALTDPRDDAVHYIGKTLQPPLDRFKQHMNDDVPEFGINHPKTRWVRDLFQQGLEPEQHVFFHTTDEAAMDDWETIYIGYLTYSSGATEAGINVNVDIPTYQQWRDLLDKRGVTEVELAEVFNRIGTEAPQVGVPTGKTPMTMSDTLRSMDLMGPALAAPINNYETAADVMDGRPHYGDIPDVSNKQQKALEAADYGSWDDIVAGGHDAAIRRLDKLSGIGETTAEKIYAYAAVQSDMDNFSMLLHPYQPPLVTPDLAGTKGFDDGLISGLGGWSGPTVGSSLQWPDLFSHAPANQKATSTPLSDVLRGPYDAPFGGTSNSIADIVRGPYDAPAAPWWSSRRNTNNRSLSDRVRGPYDRPYDDNSSSVADVLRGPYESPSGAVLPGSPADGYYGGVHGKQFYNTVMKPGVLPGQEFYIESMIRAGDNVVVSWDLANKGGWLYNGSPDDPNPQYRNQGSTRRNNDGTVVYDGVTYGGAPYSAGSIAVASVMAGSRQGQSSGFGMPLGGDPTVTQGFGANKAIYSRWNGDLGHEGIDYGVPTGTPVYSSISGTVEFAGSGNGYGNYGNYVIVQNGGVETFYAHLSSLGVKTGQNITEGMQLGLSGSTGNSTGPHLHFGVKEDGQWVNPAGMFGSPVGAPAQGEKAAPSSASVAMAAASGNNPYAAEMAAAGAKYGLPAGLVESVAAHETSDFLHPKTSPAGAVGLMQVMPSTWAQYAPGLGLTDPNDPYQSIEFGAFYLDLIRDGMVKGRQDSISWIATAYNAGPGAAAGMKTLKDAPAETQAYAKAIASDVRAIGNGKAPFAAPAAGMGGDLDAVAGVGPAALANLHSAGINSLADVRGKTYEQLVAIPEIGDTMARRLIAASGSTAAPAASVSGSGLDAVPNVGDAVIASLHDAGINSLADIKGKTLAQLDAIPNVGPRIAQDLLNAAGAPASASAPAVGADLDAVAGVGPATLANLNAAGIHSLADLRKATIEQLMEIPDIGEQKAKDLLAAAGAPVAAKADVINQNGYFDFEQYPDIGPAKEADLYAAGITTKDALLSADPEVLADIPGFGETTVSNLLSNVRNGVMKPDTSKKKTQEVVPVQSQPAGSLPSSSEFQIQGSQAGTDKKILSKEDIQKMVNESHDAMLEEMLRMWGKKR